MTTPQIGIFLLLGVMLVGFGLGRFRYELVALSGLAAGVLLGFVPADAAFLGFSSPTVITVIEILLIVQALGSSHVVDAASRAVEWLGDDRRRIVVSVCILGAVLSAFMNNIGALALTMPLAASVGTRHGIPLRDMLMPLSFATLLGGLCTVVGTPANLIGSSLIAEVRGSSLGFFELGAIGLPLTIAGLVYIFFATPCGRATDTAPGQQPAADTRILVLEALVPASSALAGKTIAALRADHQLVVHNIVRSGRFVFGDAGREILASDVLVLTGARSLVLNALSCGWLAYPDDRIAPPDAVRIEAVVLPDSILVGSPVENVFTLQAGRIVVQALGITPRRIEGRLDDVQLAVGDMVTMQGEPDLIRQECSESGLLQLAESPEDKAPRPADIIPLATFAAGIAATAIADIEPALAFGAVVLVLALMGKLSIRRGLEGMHWPSIILLAAMIPLGTSVATTGAASALADLVLQGVPETRGLVLNATMLLLAVLLTPFVNNPSTVLILAPIGTAVAARYGLPAEPVIVAITIGASLDFMTPFGHHNNTLVMGVAGYKFSDFFRMGAPLVLLSIVVTLACIEAFF